MVGLGFRHRDVGHVRRGAPARLQEALRLPSHAQVVGCSTQWCPHVSAFLFLQPALGRLYLGWWWVPAGPLSAAPGAPCVCLVEQRGRRPIALARLFPVSSVFWWTDLGLSCPRVHHSEGQQAVPWFLPGQVPLPPLLVLSPH